VGFKVVTTDSKTRARLGRIKTPHGVVETPCFIPDATYGAVKHLSSEELKEIGLQMILGNVYHLGIRPGTKLIEKMGGLRKFMNWPGPILTDSGGFQVFSLVHKNKMGRVGRNGIKFKDHVSGQEHFLTPEKSIQDQLNLGSDILMVLDYPVFPGESQNKNRYSVSSTTRWAEKSKNYFDKHGGKDKILMAIIQGAGDRDLRKRSFQELGKIGFFSGYGFGGIVNRQNLNVLDYTANLIPEEKIRYLMGSGPPKQIVKAVAMGWDLFDSVVPTRNARHGLAYTFSGEIRIWQEKYKLDKKPIERDCPCSACRNYSRAYVHHLLKIKEPLGQRLMTIHNLTFYMRLMKRIREAISGNSFLGFKNSICGRSS